MTQNRLACSSCGYENEIERVYCHNCGKKLDKSGIPLGGKAESAKAVAKRVRKATSPNRGFFVGWHKSLAASLFWSVVVAGLLLAIRPPEDLPEVIPAAEKGEYINLGDVLFNLKQSRVPRTISIRETDANRYLQNVIKPAKTGIIEEEIKFHRPFVHFYEGAVEVGVHNSFFDYPLYVSALYGFETVDGKVTAKCLGGHIGKLPIHPLVMEHADVIFSSLWAALKNERKNVFEMSGIKATNRELLVTFTPGTAAENAGVP